MNHGKILKWFKWFANNDYTHHRFLHTYTATAIFRTKTLLKNDTHSSLVSMLIIRDVFFPS